jgi:transposase
VYGARSVLRPSHRGCSLCWCMLGILIHELKSDDVVILDNLSSHKSEHARRLIESKGAELVFLPPYSPDLNPIEMVFSKVKQLLRSLACRTGESLWAAMQSVLDKVTPQDAANCFRHCGYTLRKG